MSAFGDVHRGSASPSAPPLLLIHGFTATWRAWGPARELLEESFDVLAPTVGGHTGGPELAEGATFDDMLDGLEAMMDEVGWPRAHIAGWSMGGQLALEMAVRGRAESVTAISPAGAWTHDDALASELKRIGRWFRRSHGAANRGARVLGRLAASPRFRTLSMRDNMVFGDRMTASEATAMTQAFADTPIFSAFLEASEANERPLEGLGAIDVPVTILWGDTDRVLPKDKHEPFFRAQLPRAKFVNLVKAGHTPFWDAPERVADTITQTALGRERSQVT